jgi:hypothetical protein
MKNSNRLRDIRNGWSCMRARCNYWPVETAQQRDWAVFMRLRETPRTSLYEWSPRPSQAESGIVMGRFFEIELGADIA